MPCNHRLGLQDTADVVKRAGFKGPEIDIAIAILLAESGRCVDATHTNSNGTIDRGLFQINSVHSQYDAQKLVTDPQYNANAAHDIYTSSGWGAWSTYKNGAYNKFLDSSGNLSTDAPIQGAVNVDPIDAAKKAINAPLDLAKHIWNMVGYLFTADFWNRALKIIAGGVAITIALLMAMKEFNITPPIPIPV